MLLPPPGFYFCPTCDVDRHLFDPCEHVQATDAARARIVEDVMQRAAPDRLCSDCGKEPCECIPM